MTEGTSSRKDPIILLPSIRFSQVSALRGSVHCICHLCGWYLFSLAPVYTSTSLLRVVPFCRHPYAHMLCLTFHVRCSSVFLYSLLLASPSPLLLPPSLCAPPCDRVFRSYTLANLHQFAFPRTRAFRLTYTPHLPTSYEVFLATILCFKLCF